MGVGGRSERSEALKLKCNELLGLDKNTTLKLPPEEPGGRRGRLDIRRRIEKRMDEAWNNRALLKQCISAPEDAAERIASIERLLRELWDDAGGDVVDEAKIASMSKLATIERYLRDLSAYAEEKASAELVRTAAGAAAEDRGASGTEWATEGGTEATDRRRKRERLEADEVAQYAAKFAAVAKLREALHAHQNSRDEKRAILKEVLVAMDVNRPNLFRRRFALAGTSQVQDPKAGSSALSRTGGTEAEAALDEGLQRQHGWYRELLHCVQDEKQHLPRVAHYIFDCIRQVLEFGEEFRREVFFAMLEQIQNFEFTKPIAGLVVNMIGGMEDVTVQDLLVWFEQNRGEVPLHIRELTGNCGPAATPPPAAQLTSRPASGGPRPRTLTFVTEMA